MSGSATDDHVDALLDSLTLEVSLLAGADFWHTVAIERVRDTGNARQRRPGRRGGTSFEGGPASVNAPCGTSLAATWDLNVVEAVGHLLGREARAKGGSCSARL